ncbi:glycosyltransferase (plasmid) [Isosphaeraceae bacterium EP7]
MTPFSPTAAESELASVIVPCFNQRAYTRQCLAALARHTRRPWELIVVDNGSDDGTAEYLEGVVDMAGVPVTVIRNAANLGFPAACNQGIAAARGAYLVLLNNDAVVTDGWLDQLIGLAKADPAIGLAGPMSNDASPPQLVEDVPYDDLEEMHEFAARFRAEHRGTWLTTGKLSGFCLLIRRAVVDAIGGLDERFGLGLFDDDDLCLRARRAGFEPAVACDLFVHHFGGRTFAGAGIDPGRLLGANRAAFESKWGDLAPAGRIVPLRAWGATRSDEGLPAGDPRRPRVSLTMIVRDEEDNLPACLASAAGLFDEVVVVDTGSRDRTRELAEAAGARVVEFAWVDDFAAARNVALEHATGDYAFWLDADDRVEPAEHARLKKLLSGLKHGDEAAYVVKCSCDPDPKKGGETVVDHVRLFPRLPGVRWTYRVHEQILPSLRRAGVPVRWTDVTVRHVGYAEPGLRSCKLDRDERILRRELAERPGDPFVLFNLGGIAVEREDWDESIGLLRKSLAGSAPSDSITRKLYALIARAHQRNGEPELALAACAEGLDAVPDDAELLFRRAVLHKFAGSPAEAEADWARILRLRRPEEFASVDPGIYGHLTRRNLALLAEERGDRAAAATRWREVLGEVPGDGEARAALARLAWDPPALDAADWLQAGSSRKVVPMRGPGDFDPYFGIAEAWVRALDARVVVELGGRAGSSARALLAGVHATGGRLWGVDPEDNYGIADPSFTYLRADAAGEWASIDLLHVDTDPHTEARTRRWFDLYASKCRAIALHDAHHPDSGVGAAVRAFLASGPDSWAVFEYRGNPSGWTILVRTGDPSLSGPALP